MTTARCLQLWRDQELQEFIHGECRRHSHDEQMQADFFAAAWAWISACAPDDMDIDTIMINAEEAIDLAYRAELRERRLTRQLLQICIVDNSEIRDFEAYGHRVDAGRIEK